LNWKSVLTFRPLVSDLQSVFRNPRVLDQWMIRIVKLRFKNSPFNICIQLYKRQLGLCPVCTQSLGYFIKDKNNIYYKRQFCVKWGFIRNKKNLYLFHYSCYKSVSLVFKQNR
jgi:hypothetical protein